VVVVVIDRSWKVRCAKLGRSKVQIWINCARSLARAARIAQRRRTPRGQLQETKLIARA